MAIKSSGYCNVAFLSAIHGNKHHPVQLSTDIYNFQFCQYQLPDSHEHRIAILPESREYDLCQLMLKQKVI